MTSPARRLAATTALLFALAFSVACPGPDDGIPEPQACDDPAESASLEGIAIAASYSYGGQGTPMVTAYVSWLGTDAPACARVQVVVEDISGASDVLLSDRTENMQTEELDSGGGRESRAPSFVILDRPSSSLPCQVRVTARSYGHEAIQELAFGGFPCDQDAGVDAGVDGGVDAGVDAGTDAGVDSGAPSPSDAGTEPDAGGGGADAGPDGGAEPADGAV